MNEELKIEDLTPMMQKYLETKQEYPDCILFYRLGDFYEMFFEDALTASRELEITLTGKSCGLEERAPMCGVPYHAVEGYLSKLVAKGYKVAICEQVEDPKLAKGLVKREVVRIVTPGTNLNTQYLEEGKNNYLLCVGIIQIAQQRSCRHRTHRKIFQPQTDQAFYLKVTHNTLFTGLIVKVMRVRGTDRDVQPSPQVSDIHPADQKRVVAYDLRRLIFHQFVH